MKKKTIIIKNFFFVHISYIYFHYKFSFFEKKKKIGNIRNVKSESQVGTKIGNHP